mgnify:FL=1
MPTNKLTDLKCNAAKKRDRLYKLSDGGNLYLVVHPSGGRYWRFRFVWPGLDIDGKHIKKQRECALGTYPDVPLALARKRRDQAKQHIAAGRDPVKEFQNQRAAQRDSHVATFRAEAKHWWDKRVDREQWTSKNAEHIWRSFEKHLFPKIGNRPVADITPVEMYQVLEALPGKMPITMYRRAFAVFRSAKTRGKTKDNPADIDTDDLIVPKSKGFAYLDFDEIPECIRRIEADSSSRQLQIACLMLIHTFLRRSELRLVMWAHVDRKNRLLHIPGHIMKNKRDFEVPLTDEVIALLDELETMTGDHPFLFPHRDHPNKKPMADKGIYSVFERIGYKGKTTLHGFRKTASTALNNAGYHYDAIERQLDHVDASVRGIYNKAQYMEQRRELMEAWSRGVVTGRVVSAKA